MRDGKYISEAQSNPVNLLNRLCAVLFGAVVYIATMVARQESKPVQRSEAKSRGGLRDSGLQSHPIILEAVIGHANSFIETSAPLLEMLIQIQACI